MGKTFKVNLIIKYWVEDTYDENGDIATWKQVETKYSYAIVGTNGSYQYGRLSKDEFYDYSVPFRMDTKYTNASNENVVLDFIKEELMSTPSYTNNGGPTIDFVEMIELT